MLQITKEMGLLKTPGGIDEKVFLISIADRMHGRIISKMHLTYLVHF